jgi:hypothetical protein
MIRSIIALIIVGCAWSADDAESLKKRVAELEHEIAALKASSVTYEALNQAGLNVSTAETAIATVLPACAAKVLALDVAQWTAVSAARAHAKEGMVAAARLQQPRATVDKGTMTIALRDFSVAGKSVKEELDRTLAGILGQPRLRFLNTLMKNVDEREFANFGVGGLTLTMTATAKGDYKYSIVTKQGGSTCTTSGNGSDVPEGAAFLTPFIPKGFGGELADADAAAPDHAPAKDF